MSQVSFIVTIVDSTGAERWRWCDFGGRVAFPMPAGSMVVGWRITDHHGHVWQTESQPTVYNEPWEFVVTIPTFDDTLETI